MSGLTVFEGEPLPLDWLTLSTVAYGVSGSGKTVFGRRVCEEVFRAGHRFCFIDPKGDAWGMKSSADGRGEGLPIVVFGGEHADLPLRKEDGASLGEAIADLLHSTILDLSRLPLFDRPFLLARFFEALFHHNREPILLVCDEAQDYAPQAGRSGRGDEDDVRRCLGAAINLAKQGRKRGIGRLWITQRAPGLHTEVREIAEVLAAFRTTGKNDKDRIAEWLADTVDGEELATARRSLPSLDDGECLFASSNKLMRQCGRRRLVLPTTFDSSHTPRMGEARRVPVKLSAPDLTSLRAVVGEAVERQKAEDPALLRARIAELEHKLKFATVPVPEPQRVEVFVPVVVPGLSSCLQEATAQVTAIEQSLAGLRVVLGRAHERSLETPSRAIPSAPNPDVQANPTPREPVAHRDTKPENVPEGATPGRLAERRILVALAQAKRPLTVRQLAVRTGYARGGGGFRNALGACRSHGWIDGKDPVRVTAAGVAAAGDFKPLPRGRALLQHWLDQLDRKAEREVLRIVAAAYPAAVAVVDVAEAAGYEAGGGGFRNAVGKLRTLELVSGGRELTLSKDLA